MFSRISIEGYSNLSAENVGRKGKTSDNCGMSPNTAEFFKLTAEDARAFRRFGVEIPASAWPTSELSIEPERSGQPSWCISIVIKDVSISGMSFLSTEALDLGTKMLVMLRIEAQSYPVRAIVRRCLQDRIDLGKFLVGVQFLNTEETMTTIPILIAYLRSLHGAIDHRQPRSSRPAAE